MAVNKSNEMLAALASLYRQKDSKELNVTRIGVQPARKHQPVKLASSKHKDPDPMINPREEIIARQLAVIGDQLLAKHEPSSAENRNKLAMSFIIAGITGIAVLMLVKKDAE